MTYELAKELKDAGFPQNLYESGTFRGPPKKNGETTLSHELVRMPTLEELIEKFQARYKYIDGLINDAQIVLRKTFSGGEIAYIACLDGDWESREQEEKYMFVCSTPTEAVARLYIALNKK